MATDETEPPDPMAELIQWCEANRPDVVEPLRAIMVAGQHGSIRTTEILFVIELAFAAGRTFRCAPAHANVPLPLVRDPYA